MSVQTRQVTSLTWDETSPGAWKWLTFGQLCEIADKGRDDGLSQDSFVYVHPEFCTSDLKVRADAVLIETEGRAG